MATASHMIIEIRFFVRMRGALTPPPRILTPVANIPLNILRVYSVNRNDCLKSRCIYRAAPSTDSDTANAIPVNAHW
jgi:hypothetical protein